jgi:hypothetical protein
MQLISGFIDTYLALTQSEEQAFEEELGRIEPEEQERARADCDQLDANGD